MASSITSELPVQQSGTGHCVSTMQPMRRRCSTSLTRSLSGGCTTWTRRPRRSRRIWIATTPAPAFRTSVADCLKIVHRPVVQALHDTVGVRLDPNTRIPDRLESTKLVQTRDPRPEIGVIVFRVDPDASLRRVELGIAHSSQHSLRIVGAASRERAHCQMQLKIGSFCAGRYWRIGPVFILEAADETPGRRRR